MNFSDNINLLKCRRSKTTPSTTPETIYSNGKHANSLDNFQLLIYNTDNNSSANDSKCSQNNDLNLKEGPRAISNGNIESNQDVILLEEHYFDSKLIDNQVDIKSDIYDDGEPTVGNLDKGEPNMYNYDEDGSNLFNYDGEEPNIYPYDAEEPSIYENTTPDLVIPSSYDEETTLALESHSDNQIIDLSQSQVRISRSDNNEDINDPNKQNKNDDSVISTNNCGEHVRNFDIDCSSSSDSPIIQKSGEQQHLENMIRLQAYNNITQENISEVHCRSRLETEELPESSLIEHHTYDTTMNTEITEDPIDADDDSIGEATNLNSSISSKKFIIPINDEAIIPINDKSASSESKIAETNKVQNAFESLLETNSSKSKPIKKHILAPSSFESKHKKETTVTNSYNSISSSKTESSPNINLSRNKHLNKRAKKNISLADLCAKSSPGRSRYRVGLSKKESVDHLHSYLPK